MTEQENTIEINTQPEKITATPSERVKNPKKVAAGKALAAKNKERLARLKKLEHAQQTTPSTDEPATEPLNKTDQRYLWLVGGLLITLGTGYTIARLTSAGTPPPPSPRPSQAQPPPQKITVEDDF